MTRRKTTEIIALNNNRICGSGRWNGEAWLVEALDLDGRQIERDDSAKTLRAAELWLRDAACATQIIRCHGVVETAMLR